MEINIRTTTTINCDNKSLFWRAVSNLATQHKVWRSSKWHWISSKQESKDQPGNKEDAEVLSNSYSRLLCYIAIFVESQTQMTHNIRSWTGSLQLLKVHICPQISCIGCFLTFHIFIHNTSVWCIVWAETHVKLWHLLASQPADLHRIMISSPPAHTVVLDLLQDLAATCALHSGFLSSGRTLCQVICPRRGV